VINAINQGVVTTAYKKCISLSQPLIWPCCSQWEPKIQRL